MTKLVFRLLAMGFVLVSFSGTSLATIASFRGLKIVGYGSNPDGYTGAWIATIPEPSTLLLFWLRCGGNNEATQ